MKWPESDDFKEAAGAGVGSGLGAAGIAVYILGTGQFLDQSLPAAAAAFLGVLLGYAMRG